MRYSLLALLLCQLAQSTVSAANAMRAIVMTDGKLQVQAVPIPEPQTGRVRIRVRAASVNPVDWKLAERAVPGNHSIPGRDLAGVIDFVGPEAGGWHAGQSVIAIAAAGAYADFAIASIHALALKPTHMSFAEAAGMPVVGETAWRAIVTVGNVQPGQRVLIHGGAGGVGSSAVQIAKARGAHVTATASPQPQRPAPGPGCRRSHRLPHRALRGLTEESGCRPEHSGCGHQPSLDRHGQNRWCAGLGGGCTALRLARPRRSTAPSPDPSRESFWGALSDLAEHGQFHITIDRRLPLAEAAKAWELNRPGHTGGKIILEVSH
ncbi:MAG: zinc-binding dehydrogenase [Steroidobacteraceae bacterium]